MLSPNILEKPRIQKNWCLNLSSIFLTIIEQVWSCAKLLHLKIVTWFCVTFLLPRWPTSCKCYKLSENYFAVWKYSKCLCCNIQSKLVWSRISKINGRITNLTISTISGPQILENCLYATHQPFSIMYFFS